MMAHLVLGQWIFMGVGKLAFLLCRRRLGLRVLERHPSRKAIAALLFDAAGDDIKEHRTLFTIRSVEVLGRAPVCIGGASRGREGKLNGYPLYVLSRNSADLFSPLGRELLKVLRKPVRRVVCPSVNEGLVMEVVLHDDVA